MKKKSEWYWKCLSNKRKAKFWLTSTLLNIADNERLPVCLSVCLSALSSWMRKFDFLMKTFLKCFVRFFALAKKVSQVSLTWKRVKIRKSQFFLCVCVSKTFVRSVRTKTKLISHLHLSVCLFVCLSNCLFVCWSVCLFACLSVCLFVCLSNCLFVCLSVCQLICMSVWMFT